MTSTIVQKIKHIIDGIEIGYFDTAKNYASDNFEEYFKYFGAPDKETRKYTLLLFTAMLGNWHGGSARVFIPEEKRLKRPNYSPNETYYDFKEYIKAFLEHHKNIEKEFPYMYEVIISFLIRIEKDREGSYEKRFPEIPSELFRQLRSEILIPKENQIDVFISFGLLFKEVGIKPFFESDFID